MKKANVATILVGDKKYSIESDTIVNVTLKNGVVHKDLRVVGITQMNDGLRVVGPDGINEIPTRLIKDIVDTQNAGGFSGVTVTTKN